MLIDVEEITMETYYDEGVVVLSLHANSYTGIRYNAYCCHHTQVKQHMK